MPTKPKITGGLLLLLVFVPLLGWWIYQDLGLLDENEGRQVPKIHQTDSALEERLRAILDEALDGHHQWNQQAAERCVERIRDQFRVYRQGVPGFADDVTSISTRFGVFVRMPGDWWNEDDSVEDFVSQKFAEHFFDESALQECISGSLTQFRDDIDTNRAILLSSIKVAIEEESLPQVTIPELIEFDREVEASLVAIASRRAQDSVYAGISSLLVSELGAAISTGIVARLVASMSASTVASAATSGGVTAGAATTGAGGGTVAGPIGTVIGLGVGLAVGVAIDWWMTSEFQQQLKMEMERYLFQLEGHILRGDASRSGLELALEQVIDDLHSIQSDIFAKVVNGEQ